MNEGPETLLAIARRLACLAAVAALALTGATVAQTDRAQGAGSGGVQTTSGDDGPRQSARDSGRYARLWNRVGARERRWARRTAACESGGNPRAIGGGGRYRGAFQFLRSTWRASPRSPGGDPIAYSYRTQAVVAVALKRRDGAGHWPVCG